MCRATFANFADATLGAEWRASLISDAVYLREHLDEYRSVLWSLPGFVLSMISLDADLGISQALAGNGMYEWLSLLGGAQARAASTCDAPINDLTLSMFKQ